ncbi:hypothetical protein [Nonomuraea sp. NPDC050786]|uniref:hypothetical protein n=1 Tax=Nonomuraea sp. NPDC050786 TaxID=3154840 RepID=UPI00340C5907
MDQALPSVRSGDTLVVPKLDRLDRSATPRHRRLPRSSARRLRNWTAIRESRPSRCGHCAGSTWSRGNWTRSTTWAHRWPATR